MVLNVFETFAGIGAQHKAISLLENNKFKVVATSEWDARAIIAYAQIHHKINFKKKILSIDKWTESEINNYFKDKIFSLNSKTESQITRKPRKFKVNLIAANIVNNNFSDIRKVSGDELKNIDVLTYSFPCQGLSVANMGRGKGIKMNVDSTSNLIWQVGRILEEAKDNNINLPKYLIMENVKNLIGPSHIKDYNNWNKILKDFGYTTITKVINSFHYGSIQKRERVFAISIKSSISSKAKLENVFNSFLNIKYMPLNKKERKERYFAILKSSSEYYDEIIEATPNKTPSRIRMAPPNNRDLINYIWKKGPSHTFNTLTTKQDRHPNIGMVKLDEKYYKDNKLKYRFITTREAYQIMGFSNKDFKNVKEKYKEGILTKESLYRQAGNSISVEAMKVIFEFIKEIENE